MSFNNFLNVKEGFNADNFEKGITEDNIPDPPNLKDKMPEGDTIDFAIEESLDLEFNIPEGDNCRNDYKDDMVHIWLNKYQQLEMLYRYVKRCDSFRDGTVKVPNRGGRYWWWWKRRYKMWHSSYFDYSAPCLIPPFIKITNEEAKAKAQQENGGDDCDIEKKHYYIINPKCDMYIINYWGWMQRYANSEWVYHYYDMIFGLKPRNWNWYYYTDNTITPDGWIGKERKWLESEANNYINHNKGEYNATYLLQYCPILKTLTYPNDEGKKYWKVKLNDGKVANYGGLFDKLKNKYGDGLYIDCKRINQFNNEATIGEYFRGAYFYKPILEDFSGDDCVTGGYKISKKGWEFNKKALNKWNFINMYNVHDECAKTSEYLNINNISQETSDEKTGWGYSLCDFVDRAIRNDSLNCKDQAGRVEFPEGQDENSIQSEKDTPQDTLNSCEVKKIECNNYTYNKSYSWCFNSDTNSDLLRKYSSIINSCKKNCAIGNAMNNPSDLEKYEDKNYKYYTVTQRGEPRLQWTGADDIGEGLPDNNQLILSRLINEYTFTNHNCYIDTTHATTDNIDETDLMEKSQDTENWTCEYDEDTGDPITCIEAFTNKQGIVVEGFYSGDSLPQLYEFTEKTNANKLQNDIRKKFFNKSDKRINFFISHIIEYIWLHFNDDPIFEEKFNLDTDYFNTDEENIFNVTYNIIDPLKNIFVYSYPTLNTDEKEMRKYDYNVIGNSKRIALQAKLSLIKEFSDTDSTESITSRRYFYSKINTLKKYIYAYIYILKWGASNEKVNNKLNKLDEMIEKIKNKKDDFTSAEYLVIINYLNAIKKENNSIHYRAQIQNVSTINLSKYYRIILWSFAFIGLSLIIYKKIKDKN